MGSSRSHTDNDVDVDDVVVELLDGRGAAGTTPSATTGESNSDMGAGSVGEHLRLNMGCKFSD